jgi:hypothetical protein
VKTSTELSIGTTADVKVSEQNGGSEVGYGLEELLTAEIEGLEFKVGFTNDESDRDRLGYYIDISRYHMKNDESGRTFHVDVCLSLTKPQIEKLRDYLSFALTMSES